MVQHWDSDWRIGQAPAASASAAPASADPVPAGNFHLFEQSQMVAGYHLDHWVSSPSMLKDATYLEFWPFCCQFPTKPSDIYMKISLAMVQENITLRNKYLLAK